MRSVTFTDARKNLKALIQKVSRDAEPALIVDTRTGEQAVLISVEDFQSLEETAYLLSSPANREHLQRSLKQAAEGKLLDFPTEEQ